MFYQDMVMMEFTQKQLSKTLKKLGIIKILNQ